MVPVASMIGMAVSLLVSVGVPVGALLWLRSRRDAAGERRYPQLIRPVLCGALAFVVSQVLVRLPLDVR